MPQKSLQSSEWLLVVSLLAILASLFLIAKVNSYRETITVQKAHFRPEEWITVEIDGAVRKPGSQKILAGTTLGAALKKAGPKPYADLRHLDLSASIKDSLHLEIKELEEIVILAHGALHQPTELHLPVKTRVCDLKTKLPLLPDADLTIFKSKRQLKNGEVFKVQKKEVE